MRPFPKGGGRFLLCALSYATVTNSLEVLGSPAHQVPQTESRELELELGREKKIMELRIFYSKLLFFTQTQKKVGKTLSPQVKNPRSDVFRRGSPAAGFFRPGLWPNPWPRAPAAAATTTDIVKFYVLVLLVFVAVRL